ncbi:hypothetical protein ISF_09627 [Cordyceps fumosorosea ARSEF 2679]|uniref:Uncharacterized protein n=1 Tax=Cordyceps fumosorosea (strain ARSEF 2679) TaxID=1081104 RepID=A0A162LU54_CORFA|nr:hypothetical protein ISF_09627 [Cordyceps fumosorosea ARSEF 2679]OAA44740.1 hypothetical protein ISF_09627 [Cordyceps fumosorosea ARSEF 2679]
MDDSATYARTAYDLNGKPSFVGNEQLQAHNAGHPILTPGGTIEIPDSEGPDDEDPGSTQTRNAETNADTNADTNEGTKEGTNADMHADPAPYNGANTSRRSKISRKRKASACTGGKRDAPAKRRKVFKDLSQEVRVPGADPLREERAEKREFRVDLAFRDHPPIIEAPTQADARSNATQEVQSPTPTGAKYTTSTKSSPFLLSGAEILSIIPRDECIEIEVDGCWRMQFVDKPLSSTTYRGSYTVRVTSIERLKLAGPAGKGVFWLCQSYCRAG